MICGEHTCTNVVFPEPAMPITITHNGFSLSGDLHSSDFASGFTSLLDSSIFTSLAVDITSAIFQKPSNDGKVASATTTSVCDNGAYFYAMAANLKC